MSALLIAEHNNKEIKPFTLNAITAASQIDQDLHVLVIGHSCEAVAKSILGIALFLSAIFAFMFLTDSMSLKFSSRLVF